MNVDGHNVRRRPRQGQQLWLHMPAEKFAILGTPDVPRFKRFPNEKDDTIVPPFALPGGRFLFSLLPVMVTTTLAPAEEVNGTRCEVLKLTPLPRTATMFGVDLAARGHPLGPRGRPAAGAHRGQGARAGGSTRSSTSPTPRSSTPLPAERWSLQPAAGDKVERVAVGHLVRFDERRARSSAATRRRSSAPRRASAASSRPRARAGWR